MRAGMNGRFELLKAQCQLLRTANSNRMAFYQQPSLRRPCEQTIEAITPLAVDLFDEEFATIPRVQKEVLTCGSLPLMRKLKSMLAQAVIVDNSVWATILAQSDLTAVVTLLDEDIIEPRYLSYPLLEKIIEGRIEYVELIDRVARSDDQPMSRDTYHDLYYDTPHADDIARFLKISVASFPKMYDNDMYTSAIKDELDQVAILWLCGVKLYRPPAGRARQVSAFIDLVESNHGLMKAAAILGSLEDTLRQSARFTKLRASLSV